MSQDRVMLLIDADNVSVDVMEQSVRLLVNQHGGVHVRRAYCTAESAVKHQAAFKRLGIKPMVNLAAGKNSTDIALAVDAVDLVLAERPDVVVIASSDSDFAPLVQRLREKGCVVRGIGQLGKTGEETREVYDDYTVLEHRKPQGAAAAATSPARKAAAKGVRSGAAAARGQRSPAVRTAASRPAAGETLPAPAPVAAPPALDEAAEPPEAVAAASGPARKTARKSAAKPAAQTNEPSEPKAAVKGARKAATKAAAKTAPKAAAKSAARVAAEAVAPGAAQGAAQVPAEGAPAPASPARKGRASRPKAAAAPAEAVHSGDPAPAAEDAALAAQVLQTLAAPAPPPAAEPAPALPPHELARQILALLPELDDGSRLELRVASQRLREAGLLSRSGASTRLLGRFPELFELLPAGQPNYLRLRR